MKRHLRWIVPGTIILLFLIVGGIVLFAELRTAEPTAVALAALESDQVVEVTQDKLLVFQPVANEPTTGLILYPGGFVDPRAYAPAARDIAAEGYLVVVVPMPLNLAVLGSGRAAGVIEAFTEIEQWAIGGHSLGGTMAAQYAAGHPDQIDGLVLWASYPAGNTDLSGTSLSATSIFGTRDGLVSDQELAASRAFLPADTVFVAIEGGNHAQFGSYGPQEGDLTATISAEEQQTQIVAATVDLLEGLWFSAGKNLQRKSYL